MRKYLDDIGVKDRPDMWIGKKELQEQWAEQRQIYGFDDRETWELEISFRLWLYERLKMFLDCASDKIDLDHHKFNYKDQEYTQKQLIDMMIERLEFSFGKIRDDYTEEDAKYVAEIGYIWAVVLPAMWW